MIKIKRGDSLISNIFITADPHINHDKEEIYEPRGFKSVSESDITIIKNWNSVVSDDDIVIVNGDFIMGDDFEYVKQVLQQLKGHIILVRGNHDSDAKIAIYKESDKIIDVKDIERLSYRGHKFYISHYPTLTSNFGDSPNSAVINIFGHTHSSARFYMNNPFMYNTACEAHNCTPVSLDQIVDEIEAQIRIRRIPKIVF